MIWQDFFVSFRNLGYSVLHVSVIFSIIECISDVSLYFRWIHEFVLKVQMPAEIELRKKRKSGDALVVQQDLEACIDA